MHRDTRGFWPVLATFSATRQRSGSPNPSRRYRRQSCPPGWGRTRLPRTALSVSARPASRRLADWVSARRSAAGRCRRGWRRLRSGMRTPGSGHRQTRQPPRRWSGRSVMRGRHRPACHRLAGFPRAAAAAGGCRCCGSPGHRHHRGGSGSMVSPTSRSSRFATTTNVMTVSFHLPAAGVPAGCRAPRSSHYGSG
jgi:hypothetical protein